MMSRFSRKAPNAKRKISPDTELGKKILEKKPLYVGNAAHKRNPGDFNLNPPCCPNSAKNLCDDADIFTREIAQKLLEEGLLRGLVGQQLDNGWPRTIWAVSDKQVPLEARLDQRERGTYHGFPMSGSDPFWNDIIMIWNADNERRL